MNSCVQRRSTSSSLKALTLAGIEFVTREDGAIGVILKGEQAQSSTAD